MEANSATLLTKPLAPQRGKIEENYSVDQPQNQLIHTIFRGLVRRKRAKMAALKRFLNGLRAVDENQPQLFYTIKIVTIKELRAQI